MKSPPRAARRAEADRQVCRIKSPTPLARGSQTKLPRKLINWRLRRVLRFIDDHLEETILLQDLARAAGLSRMYFAAQFRAATGTCPHEFVMRLRVNRAKSLLEETGNTIVDVAGLVGFQTQAHFTAVFKRLTGIPPARWRQLRAENLQGPSVNNNCCPVCDGSGRLREPSPDS